MEVFTVVGAVVGTLSLAFGVYRFVQSRRTRVKVEGSFVMLDFEGTPKDAIQIKAINQSAHPVRVDALGIELQDDSGKTAQPIHHVPGATIPGSIPQHDAGQSWMLLEELGDAPLDLTEPIRVFVSLAHDEDRIYSKPASFWAKEDAVA